jgi:prophage DNA circulation protein
VFRFLTVLLLTVLAGGSPAAGDASDAVRSELTRERKRLLTDARTLSDVSRKLETSLNQLASASRAVAEAAARGDGPDEIARREDAVSDAEQEVRALLEKRRLLADRVVERRRSIIALEGELTTKKAESLTGRWAVTLDPGSRRGVFRMNLDGTIVSGDYALDGGYTGSLRGTLVNDRLRLERVDSQQGFSAIFYGRVARDLSSIAGTWESTNYGAGEPGAGVWRAVREEEREENP